MPKGIIIYSDEDCTGCYRQVGYPFVIKPIDGNHGKGATTNITNFEQAEKALEAAQEIWPQCDL